MCDRCLDIETREMPCRLLRFRHADMARRIEFRQVTP
jgi:hypothetical protein